MRCLRSEVPPFIYLKSLERTHRQSQWEEVWSLWWSNFVAMLFLLSELGHKVRKDRNAFSLDKCAKELFVRNNEVSREQKITEL